MTERRYLNIPVILGTTRKGRASAHAARLLAELLNRRAGVRSEVIDIASLPLPVDVPAKRSRVRRSRQRLLLRTVSSSWLLNTTTASRAC